MNFKQAKINGVDVLHDGLHGIYWAKQDWRRLSTRDESTNLAGTHGRIVSPTYASHRQVIFEGYIDNMGNDKEQEAMEFLQSMFALQSITGVLETKELYIKDHHDNERTMDVKVADQLEIIPADDDMRDYAWKWRVVLESGKDPRYYSLEEFVKNGLEGDFGGFTMDFALDNSWDQYSNMIEISVGGNVASPLRWVIDVISDFEGPLTIKDIDTGAIMQFAIDGVIGDTIEIDSKDYTATKNGASILGQRVPGSDWLQVNGTSRFVVMSKDEGLDHSDFDINVYFRNILL